MATGGHKMRHAIEGRVIDAAAVRKADAFQALSPRSQVLEKPTMWIGSTTPEPTTVSCFDGIQVKRKEIPDYIEGIEKLWNEVLANAIDNCTYSIYCGREPDDIKVTLTPTKITIQNGGCNVPVAKMRGTNIWVPTMLWGSLFTSSHYEEAKKAYKAASSSGGTHGVGASLVNIFSDNFEVLVEDPESRLRYRHTWSRGRSLVVDGVEQEPVVTQDKGIIDTLIRISYTLNFKAFGIERYSPLMLELFAFQAITASFTAKVPVTITNEDGVSTKYDLRLISDYANLFPELKPQSSIKRIEYHLLSPEAISRGDTYAEVLIKHKELPRIEALIVDDLAYEPQAVKSPGSEASGGGRGGRGGRGRGRTVTKRTNGAYQLSFVNGINTTQHGVHVDELVKAFFGSILNELKITLATGKRYISFLLSVRLANPTFRGNSKTTLTSPKPSFDNISPSVLKVLKNWNTIDRLKALNDAEQMVSLKRTDGKKLRRLTQITELDDANFAGTSASHRCTLIIVEGGSAASYPETLRDIIEGGRDTHGILLLRGKPLNVLNASTAQLTGESGSQVYPNFKQALGLQDGVDYSSPVNFKKLRYGHVWIATDADCDGWHILCLLLLMFHERFPSLVDRGFISYLRTPVLRVPGEGGKTFFTKSAYEQWKEKALTTGVEAHIAKRKPKYYKGLGSSNAQDVSEDYQSGKGKLAIDDADKEAKEALDLGFNEKRTGDRKRWLATKVEGEFLDTYVKSQHISHFVHTGLKLYSLDNIQRAIPNIMDGMKESMRKALAAGIKKFGLKSGDRHASLGSKASSHSLPPDSKVFQIIGSTTEHFCYHHGEPILGHVISNMCKTYVGTNNVPWFKPVSSFGTIDSGKAPDPRYATLGPAWWWSYVFHQIDYELVDYVVDEGITCEPKFMLPVVCWSLCNQADGVGTGYSTRIPGHNIEEVALAHLCLLEGKRCPQLVPWWRGFRGNVSLVPRSRAQKMVVQENSVDVEDVEMENSVDSVSLSTDAPEQCDKSVAVSRTIVEDDGTGRSDQMVCILDGTYTIEGNTVIVTSLPLRTFKEFGTILAGLIEKKIVSDYRNRSKGENIRFEIDMVVDEKTGKLPPGNLMKIFRLRKIITMSNLVLLDEAGLPKRYKSAEDILKYFHAKRLHFYELRRQLIIDKLERKLLDLQNRLKLVRILVTDGPDRILFQDRPEADVLAEISRKLPRVPLEIYKELGVRHLNHDQILKLEEQVTAAQEELNALKLTTKEEMWKNDILRFLKEYRAIYNDGKRLLSEPFKVLPW